MPKPKNLIYLLVDQVRACSLPAYGEDQIATPNLDRLRAQGMQLNNAISSAPVCTPYRSMLMTGRYPQTTGHLINFVKSRHDEIGIADVFSRGGFKTGYVGKWHLHLGSYPDTDARDFVPEGRDRLGWAYWRGYNFHTRYFDGHVNTKPYEYESFDEFGEYETDALFRYSTEFIESCGEAPFFLLCSPHQAHHSIGKHAPDHCYERVPDSLRLPANVPLEQQDASLAAYRDYLAMIVAIDDMVGRFLDYLEREGLAEDTLFIFTADHGSQMGSQGIDPWLKKSPFQESLHVPWIMSGPGIPDGASNDMLLSPVDIFPTLCSLFDLEIPRTVEGYDLSDAMMQRPGAFERESVFTMSFSAHHNLLWNGEDWRGVRTKRYSYSRWVNADQPPRLFDLHLDPLETDNLFGKPEAAQIQTSLERELQGFLARLNDTMEPCEAYEDWYDTQRRIVKNAFGPMGHPETPPDWSLLHPKAI